MYVQALKWPATKRQVVDSSMKAGSGTGWTTPASGSFHESLGRLFISRKESSFLRHSAEILGYLLGFKR